ncbi:MAG: hypothetical protein KKC76_20465 [Proteobacteria bacterium]|nr:hypothetical protein [Pseudomonadota bacterium]MCG2747790.1 hypothetical protein [Desulfobulbaceae bacterium]
MALTAVVLLGIILLVLIGILLTCSNYFSDFQKYSESIHGHLYESKQALQLLADRTIKLTEDIESIHQIASDIKFQQENLEKYEINKAIKTLEGIEVSLMVLKDLHDTLSSLERSVDIIVDHPAFTTHDDDDPL